MSRNQVSLDTICASLTYALGIEAPEYAAAPSKDLCAYIDKAFGGEKADRIFMYNPDAVAQWLIEKYPDVMFYETEKYFDLKLPLTTVLPSDTPVCFGTMYTGAQPAVHGIVKYSKPVIKIDTIFDALIRAGRKPAIVAYAECSLGMIYRERDMDYFVCDTVDEANAVAMNLVIRNEHDFILVYNGNFDSTMHKKGIETPVSLGEIRANVRTFAIFSELIDKYWSGNNTLVGFAMDHGCYHKGEIGSHGRDLDEAMNITHFYKAYPKKA